MSSEKECLLLEEGPTVPDDLVINQDKRHYRECASLKAGYECTDRHGEDHAISRLFTAYCFVLHLVCLLLGVSLFLTTTTVSRVDPDLAILGM